MDVGEKALLKLEAHEQECLIRYESIQKTLDQHHSRFDKLERYLVGGFGMIATMIVLTITLLEFMR